VNFLLKILYYGVFSLVSLLGLLMVAARLFDNSPAAASNSLHGTVTMLLAAGALGILLYRAHRLGHGQGRWLAGLGAIAIAALAALAVLAIGAATYQGPVNWQ